MTGFPDKLGPRMQPPQGGQNEPGVVGRSAPSSPPADGTVVSPEPNITGLARNRARAAHVSPFSNDDTDQTRTPFATGQARKAPDADTEAQPDLSVRNAAAGDPTDPPTRRRVSDDSLALPFSDVAEPAAPAREPRRDVVVTPGNPVPSRDTHGEQGTVRINETHLNERLVAAGAETIKHGLPPDWQPHEGGYIRPGEPQDAENPPRFSVRVMPSEQAGNNVLTFAPVVEAVLETPNVERIGARHGFSLDAIAPLAAHTESDTGKTVVAYPFRKGHTVDPRKPWELEATQAAIRGLQPAFEAVGIDAVGLRVEHFTTEDPTPERNFRRLHLATTEGLRQLPEQHSAENTTAPPLRATAERLAQPPGTKATEQIPVDVRNAVTTAYIERLSDTGLTADDLSGLMDEGATRASAMHLTERTLNAINGALGDAIARLPQEMWQEFGERQRTFHENLIGQAIKNYADIYPTRASEARLSLFEVKLRFPNLSNKELGELCNISSRNLKFYLLDLHKDGYLERKHPGRLSIPPGVLQQMITLKAQGLTYAQIGEELGISKDAAGQRIRRAGVISNVHLSSDARQEIADSLVRDASPAAVAELAERYKVKPRTIQRLNEQRRLAAGEEKRGRGRPRKHTGQNQTPEA